MGFRTVRSTFDHLSYIHYHKHLEPESHVILKEDVTLKQRF